LKTGSPLLPGKGISKLQNSKLITSNMGRGYFDIFQTKPVVVEHGATSQKCDGRIRLKEMDGQGNTGSRLDHTKLEEDFSNQPLVIASTCKHSCNSAPKF
jgi:hypothetical protein